MDFEVVNKDGSDLSDVSPTIIKVVGCGGGGSNAVNRMIEASIKNVEFIALNTDKQALSRSKATKRIAIGQKLTQGLGAGGDPQIGEKAAEEDKDAIVNALKGANMVFVTAGMGGGTGTGSAPIVAKIAKEMGALTVGVVTTPFNREGAQRMNLAKEGIKRLRESVDSVIVIPNEKIIKVYGGNISFIEQYRLADDLLRQGIEGMSRIITEYGMPNIDFADVRAAMKGQGTAIFGIGEASGENRAVDAANRAINNPLLEDFKFDGAKHFIINVRAPANFSQNEMDEISKIVCASADPGFGEKDGIVLDESLGDSISVTVIATGFSNEIVPANIIEETRSFESETAHEDPNVFDTDSFSNLLGGSGSSGAASSAADTLFDNDVYVSGTGASGLDKAVERAPLGNPDSYGKFNNNDLSTPAVLRKQGLSRTINIKR